MPAKVNPVVPEVVNRVCFKVIGNDTTKFTLMAAEAGQLRIERYGAGYRSGDVRSSILSNACYNLLEGNALTALPRIKKCARVRL